MGNGARFPDSIERQKSSWFPRRSLRSSSFLSFSTRRSNKRAKRWAIKGASLGWAKRWGEVGRRWARRGIGWGEKESRFLRSPHPLLLLLIFGTPFQSRFLRVSFFRTPSQFRSLRVRFWKRLLHRLPRQVCSSLLFIVALLFLRPNLKRISIPPCFYKRHFFYTGANPCGKNNGSCAHNCVRNGSKYNCSCSTGFRLESDLHNCTGKKKWRVVICCGHQ